MLTFDRRLSGILRDGSARVLLVDLTASAIEMAARHALEGEAVALASELLVANVLLGAWIKGEERVSLQLQSNESISFFGEVDVQGHVRGRLSPSKLRSERRAVRGILLAIKHDGEREMYRGVTEVQNERVGVALQRHLRDSDQVGACIRIEATPDGRTLGLLVEPLPVSADTSNLASGRKIAEDARDIAWDTLFEQLDQGIFDAMPIDIFDQRALSFQCRCSRERVEGMLCSLGFDELDDMIKTDHGASVTCDFCAEVYDFSEAELGVLQSRVLLQRPPAEA